MGTNSKNIRDPYYSRAKKEGYRARSAYKLIDLDNELNLFERRKLIIDLCAAPGSWSQVVCEKTQDENDKVLKLAIDLFKIKPIDDVISIQADITTTDCLNKIFAEIKIFFKKDDLKELHHDVLVISDGAPDITGDVYIDEYYQGMLVCSGLGILKEVVGGISNLENDKNEIYIETGIDKLYLSENNNVNHDLEKKNNNNITYVAKIFRGTDTQILLHHLKNFFHIVEIYKPKSSRNKSVESFVYCKNFKFGCNIDPLNLYSAPYSIINEVIKVKECGNGVDPDTICEDIDIENNLQDHLYPPIDPPYKKVIEIRRNKK